ncbi:unnamed protein product [Aphanomyces euteiches]|uniref:Uncharacterized protein n=1 Tax=Aphanomyces euteiches TaxID=100861 RepID=A0A6G0WRK9_9STRA|nr:hypothetical protein Ae201684_012439 [Aphanomyces euteiches]KAH9090676.1 hypothetical protein Ae201684P_014471 [Aphanomyces euteiches]KAH9142145.1 hypothetical protein AeRB84_013764 [Aphanomyces euteiches]
MTFSIADIPDQTEKVAIVTGGTAGLGLASVISLARKGCPVIFIARSTARGEETLKKVSAALSPATFNVECGVADNEDLDSIVAFANSFLARKLPLHILLLNAGLGTQPFRLIHGVESTLFVNHVAHQLLATRLLPVLETSAPSRLVIVSSVAHTFADTLNLNLTDPKAHHSLRAYGTSKLANIMMGHGLLKRINSANVFVNSVHPGEVSTEITPI